MKAMVETYVRQARSFVLAGEPDRSVELLKKARALCSAEPQLMVVVLKDLCNACKLAGRIEEAGAYYLQLQPLLVPSVGGIAPLTGSRRRTLPLIITAAMIAVVIFSTVTWWALRAHRSPVTGLLDTTTVSSISPAKLSPREQLLRDDVGLVVVMAEYSGVEGARHYTLDINLGTGSCFPFREDGYLLTNKHVAAIANKAPTSLAAIGLSSFNLVRVSYVACFGPNPADHLPAELATSSAKLDMAILHVQRRFATPLELTQEAPHQGDEAFIAGYPGAVQDFVTMANSSEEKREDLLSRARQTGHFSFLEVLDSEAFSPQLNRGIVSVARRMIGGISHVQFDGVVGHGNSGGPLMDSQNRVIGMVTLALPDAEGKGNNWAISADELRRELQSLPPLTVNSSAP